MCVASVCDVSVVALPTSVVPRTLPAPSRPTGPPTGPTALHVLFVPSCSSVVAFWISRQRQRRRLELRDQAQHGRRVRRRRVDRRRDRGRLQRDRKLCTGRRRRPPTRGRSWPSEPRQRARGARAPRASADGGRFASSGHSLSPERAEFSRSAMRCGLANHLSMVAPNSARLADSPKAGRTRTVREAPRRSGAPPFACSACGVSAHALRDARALAVAGDRVAASRSRRGCPGTAGCPARSCARSCCRCPRCCWNWRFPPTEFGPQAPMCHGEPASLPVDLQVAVDRACCRSRSRPSSSGRPRRTCCCSLEVAVHREPASRTPLAWSELQVAVHGHVDEVAPAALRHGQVAVDRGRVELLVRARDVLVRLLERRLQRQARAARRRRRPRPCGRRSRAPTAARPPTSTRADAAGRGASRLSTGPASSSTRSNCASERTANWTPAGASLGGPT